MLVVHESQLQQTVKTLLSELPKLARRRWQGGLIPDATHQGTDSHRPNMAGFMPDFKRLMGSSKHGELDELCQRFPSLYRYAKILETVAASLRSGAIKVPK